MSNKKVAIFKLIILFIIVLIIPAVLFFTCRDTIFNIAWIQENLINSLSRNSLLSILILLILQAIQVFICILPGQPIQFAGSYLFGVVGGYLISIIGAIIGAYIAFYLAKWLGRDAVHILFGEDKVEQYRRKINSGKGLLIVLIIYLIPGLPKDLVGYVAGISEMRVLPFLIISSIGRTPGMLGSLFVGYYFQQKNWIAIVIVAIICIAILAICWIFKNKIISYMDDLEAKDKAREARHHE